MVWCLRKQSGSWESAEFSSGNLFTLGVQVFFESSLKVFFFFRKGLELVEPAKTAGPQGDLEQISKSKNTNLATYRRSWVQFILTVLRVNWLNQKTLLNTLVDDGGFLAKFGPRWECGAVAAIGDESFLGKISKKPFRQRWIVSSVAIVRRMLVEISFDRMGGLSLFSLSANPPSASRSQLS